MEGPLKRKREGEPPVLPDPLRVRLPEPEPQPEPQPEPVRQRWFYRDVIREIDRLGGRLPVPVWKFVLTYLVVTFLLFNYSARYIPGYVRPIIKDSEKEAGSCYYEDSEWKHWTPPPNKPDKISGPHDWMAGKSTDPGLTLYLPHEINYTEGGKLLLVLVGHVFDVTPGFEYYKPGSGYHGFIGRDASRAFISGEFNEQGLTDDLSGLDLSDYIGLADWLKFYLSHPKYKFVGYVVGRFFDETGKETAAMAEFKDFVRQAREEADKEGDLKKLFPTCNVEWTAEKGSTVWCSHASGGVDRDWIGFPRKFFETPDKASRCACVHPNYLGDPRVKLYEGCPASSEKCQLIETDK